METTTKKNTILSFHFFWHVFFFFSFLYKLFSLNSALLKAIRNSRSKPKSIQHEDNQNKSLEQTIVGLKKKSHLNKGCIFTSVT